MNTSIDDTSLVILDGGGTVWFSMPVLWEHYQAAFCYFGLLRPREFRDSFPPDPVTEISSLRSFNARKNIPRALLALHFTESSPEAVLERRVPQLEGVDPEMCLHALVLRSWRRTSRRCFDQLATEMGEFLAKALYNFDDTAYPPCERAQEGLERLKADGHHLAMISNRQHASTMAILRNLGIAGLLEHVEAPPDTNEPLAKPIPRLLDRYGVKEQKWRAVFIGDSNLDIASAHEEGTDLFSIAVTTGMGTARVLASEQPSAIVKSLLEAADLLRVIEPYRPRLWREHMRRVTARRPWTSTRRDNHEGSFREAVNEVPVGTDIEERVHLLEEKRGQPIAGPAVAHREADEQGLPQACVFVALEDPMGRLYVQHRSTAKRVNPDIKTISASGHVNLRESFEDAAVRELREELQVCCAVENLRQIGVVRGVVHSGPVYEVMTDQLPTPNEAELDVKESRFMGRDELELWMKCRVAFTESGYLAIHAWLTRPVS